MIRLFILAILSLASAFAAQRFAFTNINEKSLQLLENGRPVFVYNHGVISKPGVPADRARSSYIHPLYGIDGEVLTDDFPTDHYHHRGLFWAWPHVRIGGRHYDLWMLNGIEHRFESWLKKDANETEAILELENGWYVGDRKVMREELRLRALPATENERALDIDLTWIPLGEPITLEGAEGKSYGGLTLRFAPRTNTVITTPLGNGDKDLSMTQLPWADLSARFAGRESPGGAAIFVSPNHPDFPPQWLTRHYGVLCLGWPGVTPQTFQPGQRIHCRYRVWVHSGAPDRDTIGKAYGQYSHAEKRTLK